MTTPETTGRHAAPSSTSPTYDSTAERRAAVYPILVTTPLSTFFGNADNMDRYKKAAEALGAVVREFCGVDAPVVLTRPIRQMHDDDKTDTFNAAELGVRFANVTRRELEDYTEKLTAALTGKNRIKLLDGPDYTDLVAEPIVEFPDADRLQESREAQGYVSDLGKKREAAGGSLYTPKKPSESAASDAGDNSDGPDYSDVDEEDLI